MPFLAVPARRTSARPRRTGSQTEAGGQTGSWRARARGAASFLALLAFAAVVAGCGEATADGAARPESPYRGVVLETPLPRADFTLLDTEGEPFDFRAETEGYLTFLFFGYTYCPDICPVHLANLASVLQGLHWEDRSRVKVVFVSVDPDRDSPERIRQWLDAFDRSFIGLRGELEEVNAIMHSLGMPSAVFEESPFGGDYTVGHASQIIAFRPEGPAPVIYPFGTRQSEWAHDLPLLLRTESPVRVGGAVIAEPVLGERTALYAAIENRSSRSEALIEASTEAAGRVELHRQVERDGVALMEHVDAIPVPSRGRARLVPGGYHIMLLDLTRPLAAGDSVAVELVFREAGRVQVMAEVRPYADLERLLAEPEAVQAGGRR